MPRCRPGHGPFYAVTRTAHELSLVCAQDQAPPGIPCQPGWRCLQVAGPLDFALTGVLASWRSRWPRPGVSIFAISTYDTDYLLVPDEAGRRTGRAAQRRPHACVISALCYNLHKPPER